MRAIMVRDPEDVPSACLLANMTAKLNTQLIKLAFLCENSAEAAPNKERDANEPRGE